MINPEQLLGQILGGSMGGSFGGKRRRKGGLGGLLGGMTGMGGGGGSGSSSRGGGMLGGISGATKAKLGVGLLGIAYAAYDHYSKKQATPSAAIPAQSPQATAFPPPPPGASAPPPLPIGAVGAAPMSSSAQMPLDGRQRDMMLLIQAMIAAAAADGLIDADERQTILARADDAQLDAETRAFLIAELDEPKSLAAIVRATRPEIAGDVYAASCLAISLDTDAERAYLATLATRLNLPESQRQEIHQQLGAA